MNDSKHPSGNNGKNPVATFLIGLLVGGILGALFGVGLISKNSGSDPVIHPDQGAVTHPDDSTPKVPKTEALNRLLANGEVVGLDRDRLMIAFIDSLGPGDMEAQIDQIFSQRKGNRHHDLIWRLYRRWVEADLEAALRHAEGLEYPDRKSALDVVLLAWAEKDPRAVLAWCEAHGKSQEAQSARNSALQEIAKTDPEGALALAEKFGDRNTSGIFSIWAETDPESASNRAESIQNTAERQVVFRSVAANWANTDPQAAWEWANALPRKNDRMGALEMILDQVSSNGDFERANEFIDRLPNSGMRRKALEDIAWRWAYRDPEKAYEFVRAHTKDEAVENAYSSVFQQWAERDPDQAFEVAAEKLPPGFARYNAIEHALKAIATREPARALEMLNQLDEVTKERTSSSLARTLAEADQTLAVRWAESLPKGEAKENSLSTIFDQWAGVDPLEAVAYGLTIENDSLRRRSLGRALDQWGRDDAVPAMTWAVENLSAKDQDELIPRLLGRWADEDVEGAAEWVAALPDGGLRDSSVSSLVSSWARRDLAAAGEFLKTVPKGKGRDSAVSDYAALAYDTDPEAALAWAESISDESTRFEQVKHLAREYLRHDPEKARRWISNSSLPPEKKAELLK